MEADLPSSSAIEEVGGPSRALRSYVTSPCHGTLVALHQSRLLGLIKQKMAEKRVRSPGISTITCLRLLHPIGRMSAIGEKRISPAAWETCREFDVQGLFGL